MGVLREADLADFLKKKSAKASGLMLFGNDASAISAATRQVIVAMAGDEEPQRLDASQLKNDPAILDDAFRSMSLLGDRRLVILADVEETHLSVLQPLLEERVIGNFVVLVSDSLKKGSKLRSAVEQSQLFSAVGFYEEAGAALVTRARALMQQRGLAFAESAAERFVDLCGTDRAVLAGEAEKLSLYCHPATTITQDDVEAVCGDQAEYEADQLIQAVLDGDVERADRIYASMLLSGDGKSVLIMLQMHLARLEAVSAALSRGGDFASACRAARPPIFEKQQPAAQRHIRAFSGDDLGRAQVAVQHAILQSRQMADLGDAITGRCLLSLARMARQLRARAAA
jgi:DNA polymerase III subunit delta